MLLDYHSPNLLWLRGREGVRRVGILDFQDTMIGPTAYDVASLEKAVHDHAQSRGLHMGTVVNALRVATTGQGVGPGLYDCLAILGRVSCRDRIKTTLEMLQAPAP